MATVDVIGSLQSFIDNSDEKTQKRFNQQKRFMRINPNYNSLGKTKLTRVKDKYGNELWEVRLDKKRRIVLVEKNTNHFVWLKICSHDELKRKNVIYY